MNEDTENPALTPMKTTTTATVPPSTPVSFIDIEILKHLFRELDRDKVEAEFSLKVNTGISEISRQRIFMEIQNAENIIRQADPRWIMIILNEHHKEHHTFDIL